MFMTYLKDRIAVVRENGVEKLAGLIQTYKDWALGKLFTKLVECINKENGYLYRLTSIQSLRVRRGRDCSLVVGWVVIKVHACRCWR